MRWRKIEEGPSAAFGLLESERIERIETCSSFCVEFYVGIVAEKARQLAERAGSETSSSCRARAFPFSTAVNDAGVTGCDARA